MRYPCLPVLWVFLASLCTVAHAAPGDQDTAVEPKSSDAQDSPAPAKVIPLPSGVSEPIASRQCSPDNPRIGTEVSCLIRVEHPKTFSVGIAVPPGFSGRPQAVVPDEKDAGQLITTRQVSITPLSMRKLKLFGFSTTWSHESGAKGTVLIKDEYMAMASMMGDVDEPTFRTFRGPVPDFNTFWSRHGVLPLIETNWYLMVALMVLVLGGLLSLIIVYVQKLRAQKRAAEVPWVDPRPAHIIANESLEVLSAEALPEQGLTLEFYLRLSEILRVFLENRFGIAIERGRGADGQITGLRFTAATTEEIEVVLVKNDEITEAGLKALMECLGVIDYVVFGGIRPHVGQTEADRRRIRNCIDLNKRLESEVQDGLFDVDADAGTDTETSTLSENVSHVLGADEPLDSPILNEGKSHISDEPGSASLPEVTTRDSGEER